MPWHFWDPAGGADGRGGWMDERRWPELRVDGRGGRPPRGLMQPFQGGGRGGGYSPSVSPWQQDYVASTAAALTRRGSQNACAVLAWMANLVAGRFHAEAKGLGRHDAVNYTLALFPLPLPDRGAPPAKPFTTWAEIGAATRMRGTSNGDGWAQSVGEYARLGLLSLAVMIEVLDLEEARQAYAWLAASDAPYTSKKVFARMPQHNIVPRGMPRVPSRQQCSTAASAPRTT